MRSRLRRTRRPLIALVVLVAALVVAYVVKGVESDQGTGTPFPSGSGSTSAPSGSPSTSGTAQGVSVGVSLSSLPPQAAQTVRLIRAGGPFPYPANDGTVYHNLNHDLPRQPDGYYHEYTVPTPGDRTRGARRIVRGNAGEYWYTGNHYETFVRVDVAHE